MEAHICRAIITIKYLGLTLTSNLQNDIKRETLEDYVPRNDSMGCSLNFRLWILNIFNILIIDSFFICSQANPKQFSELGKMSLNIIRQWKYSLVTPLQF